MLTTKDLQEVTPERLYAAIMQIREDHRKMDKEVISTITKRGNKIPALGILINNMQKLYKSNGLSAALGTEHFHGMAVLLEALIALAEVNDLILELEEKED